MEDSADKDGEDLFSIVCGDLGLGEGQRSSNFLNYELNLLNFPHGTPDKSSDLEKIKEQSTASHSHLPHEKMMKEDALACKAKSKGSPFYDDHHDKGTKGSIVSHVLSNVSKKAHDFARKRTDSYQSDDEPEVFPTYADVPYGTSLRQQKKLYEQEIGTLRRQHGTSMSEETETTSKDKGGLDLHNMSGDELDAKLVSAMQEMDELKLELDTCRKRLDAKYRAVTILKQQAELADSELRNSEKKFHENNKRLEQEVSKLQFQLEWRESSFMDSQQTWAERFDRVCQENAILMSKLEARSEELRRTTAHKTAIARERDELLALLDVTERNKYEQGKSQIAEEEYGSFSSSELAVLGACKCRGQNPEPCGCAHAAANLRKEVAKLREEAEMNVQRREESYLTVDAYRIAFEEQLKRNRDLTLELAKIATTSSRSAKAKAAIKWLLQVLSEDGDDDAYPTRIDKEGSNEKKTEPNFTLHELVSLLTDMIQRKNEALAHKKLAAQVLASKLKRLESGSDETENYRTASSCSDYSTSENQSKCLQIKTDGDTSMSTNIGDASSEDHTNTSLDSYVTRNSSLTDNEVITPEPTVSNHVSPSTVVDNDMKEL